MNLAFACTKQDEQGPERTHRTSFVMKRCPCCGQHAVAGYQCLEEGCGHQEVDADDELLGHGEGKCQAAEVNA